MIRLEVSGLVLSSIPLSTCCWCCQFWTLFRPFPCKTSLIWWALRPLPPVLTHITDILSYFYLLPIRVMIYLHRVPVILSIPISLRSFDQDGSNPHSPLKTKDIRVFIGVVAPTLLEHAGTTTPLKARTSLVFSGEWGSEFPVSVQVFQKQLILAFVSSQDLLLSFYVFLLSFLLPVFG